MKSWKPGQTPRAKLFPGFEKPSNEIGNSHTGCLKQTDWRILTLYQRRSKMNTTHEEKQENGLVLEEEEEFGISFHKSPFLIAAGITILLYLMVFLFVSEEPPAFDPADLPPPPAGS